VVVPFRLPLARVRIVAEGFIQRRTSDKFVKDSSAEPIQEAAPETPKDLPKEPHCNSEEDVATESHSEPENQIEPNRSSTTAEPQQREFEFSIADKGKALALSSQAVIQTTEAISHAHAAQELFPAEEQEIGRVDPELEYHHEAF
jgi:hypothetical protein